MAAAHHRDRRFGRTEHAHLLVLRRQPDQRTAVAFRAVALGRADDEARQPPKRRIAGRLAQRDLARIERLAVAQDQRLHHRMLGLMRLQQSDAAALLAAGAADHLMQHLEGALGGARIAVAEA